MVLKFERPINITFHCPFHKVSITYWSLIFCTNCQDGDKYPSGKWFNWLNLYVRPKPCDHCHKIYNETNHLKQHILVHTSVKPHTCNNYHLIYKKINYFKQHMPGHTSTRPWICFFLWHNFHVNKPFQETHCSTDWHQNHVIIVKNIARKQTI